MGDRRPLPVTSIDVTVMLSAQGDRVPMPHALTPADKVMDLILVVDNAERFPTTHTATEAEVRPTLKVCLGRTPRRMFQLGGFQVVFPLLVVGGAQVPV
jgi:hypothetical protein